MLKKEYRKNGITVRSISLTQLCLNIRRVRDSVRREVLYSVLIETGVHIKLIGIIKMPINKTYSKIYRSWTK
jgi:hypothetical protein